VLDCNGYCFGCRRASQKTAGVVNQVGKSDFSLFSFLDRLLLLLHETVISKN